MRGLIWNCRGVGKKGMATCLSDMISDHSLDFIGLQETMKEHFTPKCIRRIDPFGLFHWEWIPSVGKSGGILSGVRHDTLDVTSRQPVRLHGLAILKSTSVVKANLSLKHISYTYLTYYCYILKLFCKSKAD